MDQQFVRQQFDDFRRFCDTVDVRRVIDAADPEGRAPGYEKELYALAILRAARTGVFGDDNMATRAAISALWEQGSRYGFNPDSFNAVFEEYFSCW